MSAPRFVRPKSLYIEAVAIRDDGSEFVTKMRLHATANSRLHLEVEALTLLEDDGGLYATRRPTGERDVKIEFTRCRFGDPDD